MKNLITLENKKSPYKDGIVFKYDKEADGFFTKDGEVGFDVSDAERLKQIKFVDEIQEPKWTDSQLKNHLLNFLASNCHLLRNELVDGPTLIDNYMKNINK